MDFGLSEYSPSCERMSTLFADEMIEMCPWVYPLGRLWPSKDSIGIWPTNENALEIARRRMEILRSGVGRRMVMEEIDEWIATASDRKD
jgi:hypothetical protein